jgi:hypothetical protein
MSDAKTIEFLRLGNPWLVGKNVNRVVPIYSLHNLISPNFKKSDDLQAVKDLCIDAEHVVANNALEGRIPTDGALMGELTRTAFGVLSPERRIFQNKKSGGAGEIGSLFPVVGGLSANAAGDDGLGKRLRQILEHQKTDWLSRLETLMLPSQPRDPVTNFAVTLLGGEVGTKVSEEKKSKNKPKLTSLDREIGKFIDKLLVGVEDARRIAIIRDLAIGAYFASILRLVSGPSVEADDALPLVFVYGGLPPGLQHEPAVSAACKSYQTWIASSWHSTAKNIVNEMARIRRLPKSTTEEARKHRIRSLMKDRGVSDVEAEKIIVAIARSLRKEVKDEEWILDLLDSKAIGFSKSEFSRRVRSLGTNVGLVGPDRGYGSARLFLDTPLIAVLVRGIVGDEPMEFDHFISELARRFGLVLGLGDDDSVVDRLTLTGSSGFDGYELLEMNQRALRERMLRAGLARSYSDSHTEVLCNG